MSHPSQRLDEVVHQRVRLGILAVLWEAQRADFAYLRETLGLTDGNLARHLRVLEEAGYVSSARVLDGRRPRTWVEATPAGIRAFEEEVQTLRELLPPVPPAG
ncbi:MAG: transcriptional regulator [Dehalococcoidia bacterium]|nr:transcriptional regulator [Dehalococcoidia bacterium]